MEGRCSRSRNEQGEFYFEALTCHIGDFLPVSPCSPFTVHVCILLSPSFKDTSRIRLGSTQMTSFNLNYLIKELNSKYTHSEVLGFRTSTYGFGEDTSHSIAGRSCWKLQRAEPVEENFPTGVFSTEYTHYQLPCYSPLAFLFPSLSKTKMIRKSVQQSPLPNS